MLLVGLGGGEAAGAGPVVADSELIPIVTKEDDVLRALAAFGVEALNADPVDCGLRVMECDLGIDLGLAGAGAFLHDDAVA